RPAGTPFSAPAVPGMLCAGLAAALAGRKKRRNLGSLILWGSREMYWLYWLFILILLAAAGGAALLAYRTYVLGDTSAPKLNVGGWLFRPRPEPRPGVLEQASADARRPMAVIRTGGRE